MFHTHIASITSDDSAAFTSFLGSGHGRKGKEKEP